MKMILKQKRDEKGFTQRQLAAKLGVTQGSVNKWENGSCWPSVPMLYSIAQAIGCKMDDLVERESS